MSTPTIYPGENRRFSRSLYLENGTTTLPVASLSYARAELYQQGTLLATYLLSAATNLRAGSAANELILELTSTFTATLTEGRVLEVKWTLKVADTDFTQEPNVFVDMQLETLAEILKAP